MSHISWYRLLRDGIPEEWMMEQLKNMLRELLVGIYCPECQEKAREAIENLLCDTSRKWVTLRLKIVENADRKCATEEKRNKYILRCLKRIIRDAAMRAHYPLFFLLRRQIADHLRMLRAQGVLQSYPLEISHGIEVNLWGMREWGDSVAERKPCMSLDRLVEILPLIPANSPGQSGGLIDYKRILPEYIVLMLRNYGAPLTTDRITRIIVSKIDPPFDPVPHDPSWPGEKGDDGNCSSFASSLLGEQNGFLNENILSLKELLDSLVLLLTAEEKIVLRGVFAGKTFAEIAEERDCSVETIKNRWKSIVEKGRSLI